MKVVVHGLPEWIEDKLDAFPSSHFGGGDKVTVACDEDDGVHLPFERQCGDVYTNPHIYTLLPEC